MVVAQRPLAQLPNDHSICYMFSSHRKFNKKIYTELPKLVRLSQFPVEVLIDTRDLLAGHVGPPLPRSIFKRRWCDALHDRGVPGLVPDARAKRQPEPALLHWLLEW